jgi:hypothetical protein
MFLVYLWIYCKVSMCWASSVFLSICGEGVEMDIKGACSGKAIFRMLRDGVGRAGAEGEMDLLVSLRAQSRGEANMKSI